MKPILLLLLVLCSWCVNAQVKIPIQSLSNGGGATGVVHPTTTIPTFFGSIGQPMVSARPAKISNGGGVMNANDIMFSSSVVDNEAPVVNYDESSTLDLVKATVTDNKSISSAKIYFRPIGGTQFDSVSLTAAAGDIYQTTIMNTKSDAMGLEFYFKGKDTRNVTRDPAGTGTYYLYKVDPGAHVPASLLVYGSEQSKYRMISVPYVESGSVVQVFTELAALEVKKKYRLWKYVSGTWTEYSDFNTIERGLGYFFICTDNTVALELGSETAPSNNRANLFTLNLTAEWNLIGNPYTTDIDWDDVLTLNGNPAGVGSLHVFNGTSYDQPATLKAFQGAFVKVTGSAPANFKIGFAGQTSPGGRQRSPVSSDLASTDWEIPFVLQQGELQNTIAGIGMRLQASDALDRYDDYNPPHFFDFVELLSQRPELKVNDLTKDIVATQSAFVWKFESKSSSGDEIELHWDNTKFGDNTVPLYLYDQDKNQVVNMRQETSYKFAPRISRQFKVYFGLDVNAISPDVLLLNAPYPNPFGETSEFRFALPGQHDSFQVELNLFNSMGQRVKTLARGNYTSGRHTVTWNGQGDDDDKVAGGMYFYKLTVEGKQSRVWDGRIIYTR